MTTDDLTVVSVQRMMLPKDADKYVGLTVPPMEPSMPAPGPLLMLDADTQAPVMIYAPLRDAATLRRAILATPMTTTYRSSGLTNVSRTFGMAPRKPIQWREGCAPTSLARDEPAVMGVLTDYAAELRDMLDGWLPDVVDQGRKAVSPVLPEWRLADDALWTSGVINLSSELPYHRDRFNFDAWSAMAVLRRGTRGGYLHVPEYDLVVPCRDGWALFWSGFQLVHGVTPIHKVEPDGYRYSIVYYALKGMKDCYTAAVETKYAREKRTAREHAAPAGMKPPADDDGDPYGRVLG
jgi:hypothetical protein